MLKCRHLADRYRFDHLIVSTWIWSNDNGSFKFYTYRIVVRTRDDSSFSCPQFLPILHGLQASDMKDEHKVHKQGSGY